MLSPILVEVARDLDVSTSAVGQLRAITGLVAGSAALLLGRIVPRLPLRDLLIVGAGLLVLGSVLSGAATGVLFLALAQAPIGLGVALLLSAGAAGAAEWAGPEERPRVLSWALAGQPAAWIVTMPLAGVIGEASWRLAFLTVPLAAGVLAVVVLTGCAAGAPVEAPPRAALTRLLRDPVVAGWAAGELLGFSAWAGTLVYAGAILVESYGSSLTVTGIVLAGAAAAAMAGNFFTRRLLPGGIRRLLIALALAAGVGVVLLGVLRERLWVSIVVLCVLALLGGARTLAGSALGLEAAPDDRLAVMGLRTAANQYGYLVGSAAGGAAIAASGYGALGVVFGAFFLLAAAPHLVQLRRERARSGPGGARSA